MQVSNVTDNRSGRIHIQWVTQEVGLEWGWGDKGESALLSMTFLKGEHIQALLAQSKVSKIKGK